MRGGDHYFYNDYDRFNSRGLLAFSRTRGAAFSLVIVNFTDQPQATSFRFPIDGSYAEQLEGQQNIVNVVSNADQLITVTSNYG
jgi:hypothetical protein